MASGVEVKENAVIPGNRAATKPFSQRKNSTRCFNSGVSVFGEMLRFDFANIRLILFTWGYPSGIPDQISQYTQNQLPGLQQYF